MYIYPNTNLRILTNVNLNNDYDHTIYFDGKVAQTEYFLAKTKFNLTNQSYQRKERGWIQVDINQNSLWDCTYLMYQNTAYHNKWFYAFILSVEYVNDTVSKINFEIDVMQTWYFDYILDKCFVEREHSTSDILFNNTVPEKLDIGLDYYECESATRELFTPDRLLIITASDKDNVAYSPRMEAKVFTGLKYKTYDLSLPDEPGLASAQAAIDYLTDMINAGLEDNIVMILQYPHFIGRLEMDNVGCAQYNYNFTPNFTTVNGYTPKNNKLFCYPYNYMVVTDKEGNEKEFKWEMWGNNRQGYFNIEGCGYGKPIVRISPLYYRTSSFVANYDESMTYDNFPVCAWVGDSFQVWLAQNKYRLVGNTIAGGVSGTMSAGLGIATGNPYLITGGISTLIHGVSNVLGSIGDAKHMPQKAHGNPATALLNIQNNTCGFDFKQMAIPYEYARIIDEYFSRFGYMCGRIKIPNQKARQKWTYTKTIGCEMNGNVPSDDLVKIKEVYDKGVTFWDIRYANIGEYGDFTNPTLS